MRRRQTSLVVTNNGRIIFAPEDVPTSKDEADIRRILEGL